MGRSLTIAATTAARDTTMAEYTVYLEKLAAFSRMLRREGLAVGPSETADAAFALTQMGFGDREQVKTVLRTVYAASREEQRIFDRTFDGFFLSEEAMRAQAKERMEREAEMVRRQLEAQQDLERFGQPVQLTDQQRQTYAAMPEEVRQRLRGFMDKYQGTAERNPKLYGEFIHSVFAKTLLEQQMLLEDAGSGVEGEDPELGILYRDIQQFRDQEIPRAIEMIRKVASQINGQIQGKKHRGGRSAQLDFRRTIRCGLESGGSFYRLRYKKRPRRRKQLVLLCDVSGSMMQFSEFALRFVQSLDRASDSSRVFLYSETMVEADAFRLQNMDQFRGYVKESGVYGRGTDLGTALELLCRDKSRVLNSAATLIILSDTKTIDQNRALAALQEAKRRCGRVLLLNPIPQSKWKYLRSVQAAGAVCPMVSCSTLGELAAACKRLTD